MSEKKQISILFVCMGNICRSPMAEGAFRKCLQAGTDNISILVDSAGTHGYHTDAPPDTRAQTATARRGIDISSLKARCIVATDFEQFDYILAMDQDNHEWLIAQSPAEHHDKIKLFLDFSSRGARMVEIESRGIHVGLHGKCRSPSFRRWTFGRERDRIMGLGWKHAT